MSGSLERCCRRALHGRNGGQTSGQGTVGTYNAGRGWMPAMTRICCRMSRSSSEGGVWLILSRLNAASLRATLPRSSGYSDPQVFPRVTPRYVGLEVNRGGRPARNRYVFLVLRDSKEKRSMEPRQLRLPGFTRLWAHRIPALALQEPHPSDACGQRRSVAAPIQPCR